MSASNSEAASSETENVDLDDTLSVGKLGLEDDNQVADTTLKNPVIEEVHLRSAPGPLGISISPSPDRQGFVIIKVEKNGRVHQHTNLKRFDTLLEINEHPLMHMPLPDAEHVFRLAGKLYHLSFLVLRCCHDHHDDVEVDPSRCQSVDVSEQFEQMVIDNDVTVSPYCLDLEMSRLEMVHRKTKRNKILQRLEQLFGYYRNKRKKRCSGEHNNPIKDESANNSMNSSGQSCAANETNTHKEIKPKRKKFKIL